MTSTKAKALSIPEKLGMNPAMEQQQILALIQRTPKSHVYTRPARGGGVWQYVTGTYVEKVLNYVFGWDWSFEIKDHGREKNQIWVLGKLTVNTINGRSLVKEQFGRQDIKQLKAGGDLDFGNDLKAAATDSLKKCASLLGVASDIYGKEEFKEVSMTTEEVVKTYEDDDEPATDNQIQTMNSLGIVLPDEFITKGMARKAIMEATKTK